MKARIRRRREANRTITGSLDFIHTHNPGRLIEFVAVSPSSNYYVHMVADGEVLFNESWPELNAENNYVETYGAYQEGSSYVFSTSGWSWNDEFTVRIGTNGQITFTLLYAVWVEYVEEE